MKIRIRYLKSQKCPKSLGISEIFKSSETYIILLKWEKISLKFQKSIYSPQDWRKHTWFCEISKYFQLKIFQNLKNLWKLFTTLLILEIFKIPFRSLESEKLPKFLKTQKLTIFYWMATDFLYMEPKSKSLKLQKISKLWISVVIQNYAISLKTINLI